MPTLNINGNIRTNTAAGWGADATVYTAKTILVTTDATYGATDQRKFKIADGSQTWSNLDYFPVSGYDDATSSIQTQLDSKKYGVDFGFYGSSVIADSTSYYFGQVNASPATTTSGAGGRPLRSGTITGAIISVYNASTIPSNESITLNLLHGATFATSNLITNTLTIDANRHAVTSITGLSINIAADTHGLCEMIVPVMATNGNAVQMRLEFIYG